MVRTLFSLAALIFCASLLAQSAHAQTVPPRSYLFVEVADATGRVISDATVRLSTGDSKAPLNLKTDRTGTVKSSFFSNTSLYHYDLQVSKSGYLSYESVLFASVPHHSYHNSLTEEIPGTTGPPNSSNGPPIKITLRRSPVTRAEFRTAEIEDKKRQLLLAAKRGDEISLRRLLQQGLNADTTDAKGVPAIAWATFAGDPETITLLLEAGANVRNKARQSLLLYFAEGVNRRGLQLEIIDKLIAAGADANASNRYHGTVLNRAIYQIPTPLRLTTIKALIKAGANVNAADANGQTPLMIAAWQNQTELFDLLLNSGAKRSVNAKDRKGRTALLYAVDSSSVETVRILIAAGASVGDVNEKGETPLIIAVQRTLPDLVKLLLTARASINIKDKSGNTALMYARSAGSGPEAEIFEALIDAGASLTQVNEIGETPLIVAAAKKNNLPAVRRILVSVDALGYIHVRTKYGQTALIYAAAYSDPETVATLLQAGANVHDADNSGQTVLMRAVARYDSSLDLIKMLLKAGANVNAADANRRTALLHLTNYSYTDSAVMIFKELLAAKANVNATDADGQTVLMSIIQRRVSALLQPTLDAGAAVNAKDRNGRTALSYALSDQVAVEIVRALIAAGANVNDADQNGQTPLILAAHKESAEAVKMLLAAGAEINAKDKAGQTALMRAAIAYDDKDSTEVVKTLIAAKAKVDDVDQSGQTALMLAAHTNFVNTVQALLEAGASVKTKDRQGRTALSHAADEARSVTTGAVELLIAAGAKVNELDGRRQTPLMLAALRGSIDTVTTLLKRRASVNVKDEAGLTALMFAAWGAGDSSPHKVKALLKAGAKVNEVDKEGRSALMFAAEYGLSDSLQLLLASRASINARNVAGETPLMFAIKGYSSDERKIESVRLLLRSGADVNVKDKEGQTALALAQKLRQPPIIKLIEAADSRR